MAIWIYNNVSECRTDLPAKLRLAFDIAMLFPLIDLFIIHLLLILMKII